MAPTNAKEAAMTSAIGRRGFTLVELCFTITIVGLIVGLSWPSLRAISNSIKARAAASAFAQELQISRERAVLAGVTQRVSTPIARDIQSSSREVVFLPDGTARPAHVTFGLSGDSQAFVDL